MRKILFFMALAATVAVAQDQPPGGRGGKGGGRGGPPMLATQQLKPGLYMITGAGANTEVRVTNEGLIVVDGKLPGEANYNALMDQIKMISNQPIKYLIVTHHHADHSGNNDRFLAAGGIQIIAHENLNKNLLTYNATPKPAAATVTYAKDYSVHLGGVEVQVHHYANAHTSGDSVVYFPDLKVVAVSDEVTTGTTGPLADYGGGGSFLEWSKALDGILSLDFDTAIAGNGNPLTKADVQAYKTKIDTFVGRAKEAIRQGVPKDQLMTQVKTDDFGWMPRVPAVDPFYDELSKAK